MRLLKEIQSLMGNYHLKSGVYHYYRNEYPQAVDFLRKALKDEDTLSASDRRNLRYYLTLSLLESAQRLHGRGEHDEAAEQLGRAAEVSPAYPDIRFRLGQALDDMGRGDDAAGEYRKAIDCNPRYLEAHVALAFCLLRQDRRAEADTAFRRALEVKKDRMSRPFDRGIELLSRGDTERATEQFHEAFLALPEVAHECLKKALHWLKSEEHERALAELDRALERNPRYPDLHNFRGVVLCELDRVEEALEAFRVSSEQSPCYLVPRLNRAFALIRLGEYPQAAAELESILEIEPGEPAAAAKLEELRSGRLPERRRPATRGSTR
jgi:tetratricopeptide (TPR) repeat protein